MWGLEARTSARCCPRVVGPHSSSCGQQAMSHPRDHGVSPAPPADARAQARPYGSGQGGLERRKSCSRPHSHSGVELHLNPDLLLPIHMSPLGLLRAKEIKPWGVRGGQGEVVALPVKNRLGPLAPEYRTKAKGGGRYQLAELSRTAVPKLFCTRDWFCRRQFFHGLGSGEGFGMTTVHYIQAHLLL